MNKFVECVLLISNERMCRTFTFIDAGKLFLQASVSIRCRRCACRLDKTLTSSFSRTSPTTTPLLGLHPAVLYLSPRFLLPTLHYPHAINVVHLINLSIRHITSATPTKLSSNSSPYRSQRAFRMVPEPAILLGTPGFKFPAAVGGHNTGGGPGSE